MACTTAQPHLVKLEKGDVFVDFSCLLHFSTVFEIQAWLEPCGPCGHVESLGWNAAFLDNWVENSVSVAATNCCKKTLFCACFFLELS